VATLQIGLVQPLPIIPIINPTALPWQPKADRWLFNRERGRPIALGLTPNTIRLGLTLQLVAKEKSTGLWPKIGTEKKGYGIKPRALGNADSTLFG